MSELCKCTFSANYVGIDRILFFAIVFLSTFIFISSVQSEGRKFDIIFGDLTDTPVTVAGGGNSNDTLSDQDKESWQLVQKTLR